MGPGVNQSAPGPTALDEERNITEKLKTRYHCECVFLDSNV